MDAPLLWFTSRTPTDVGQRTCAMARFLGNHAGEHGTGYRRKALSVPLATGGAVHTGIELLANWLLDFQAAHHAMPPQMVPLEVIAWAATESAARYEASARAKGFQEQSLECVGIDPGPTAVPLISPTTEKIILEQRTLIEAQVWVFALAVLPEILSHSRILDSEAEETLVLDCACGLGEGIADWTLHQQRGCTGIVQQGRADLIIEGFAPHNTGQICYDEVKTKATPHFPWEKAWEHSGQLRVNMDTAARRLGRQITAAYIPVLFKGARRRAYGVTDGPKEQDSALVYGWFDPGSPGFRPAAWASSYKWQGEDGKGHTLPKTYRKQPIWDESVALPKLVDRPQASRVECWVRGQIKPGQYATFAKVLGPFPHQLAAMPDTLRSILAEERDWRFRMDAISDLQRHAPKRSQIDLAGDVVPRSFQCIGFDGVNCQFLPICDKQPGWEQPLHMGLYEIRTPHHAPEREAFEAAGVEFPQDDTDEFEDLE